MSSFSIFYCFTLFFIAVTFAVDFTIVFDTRLLCYFNNLSQSVFYVNAWDFLLPSATRVRKLKIGAQYISSKLKKHGN